MVKSKKTTDKVLDEKSKTSDDELGEERTVKQKLADLENLFREMGEVMVAFSGGVDSSLLARVALNILGENAVITTAVSPSLATGELEHCRQLAKRWDFELVEMKTAEMEDERYRENDLDRCYWCKSALVNAMDMLRAGSGGSDESKSTGADSVIVLGVNTDDLSDHRPGIVAAREGGARFPFVEVGISKTDVREISQELKLETWDKPAEPCLASRVPFGVQVSQEVLGQIDLAESGLKEMGFSQLRVRHEQDTARIEVPEVDFEHVMDARLEIAKTVKSAGYKFVALDLEGLKTGNLLPESVKGKGVEVSLSPSRSGKQSAEICL